jgi:sugar phosphate isomerase/epimerase
MWAQQARFQGDFSAFVSIARDAGFGAIEVSHSTDHAGLDECLRGDILPVTSLHAPAPYQLGNDGRPNSDLNLAATDADERRAAVMAVRRTIDFAATHGIRSVVVHLGHQDSGPRDEEQRLRELFAAGKIIGSEAGRVRAEAWARRTACADRHMEAARRSLDELVGHARPRGVAIGVETRLHFYELPSLDEAVSLLSGYGPDEAGYWHDTGHAEIWARLGLTPHLHWLEVLGDRLIGVHLHDVRELRDHRAPGTGTLDWATILERLPDAIARTCEIDQHEPEASLADAVRLLS